MALDDWKLQAIEESNAINQSPDLDFNFSNMFGLGNNQGTPSASMNVRQNMQPYFSGTNPGAYGSGDWRSNMNQLYNWRDSGARYNYNRPYDMSDVAGEVGEYSQRPGEGIMKTDQAQKKGFDFSKLANLLPGGMLRGIMSNFKDSPQEAFNREYFPTAERGGSQRVNLNPASDVFGNKNVSYAFGPGLEVGAQKRIDTLQRTIDKMEAGKSWTQLKEDDLQAWEAKRDRLRARQTAFKNQLAAYNKNLQIETGRDPIPSGADTTGGAVTTRVPQHHGDVSRSRGDHQAPAFREAPKSWDVSSGMGPGGRHYAYGGRAGYQGGELVGQETDFIEGPQGGEEFQETVVEGQEQPSREQLEALAMEIFQLPLEELDEQQLLVVYQAAMQGQPMEEDFQENIQFADQGQPMEEDIQEEDIQFAANGGLASLL